jgi:hypothetical protein
MCKKSVFVCKSKAQHASAENNFCGRAIPLNIGFCAVQQNYIAMQQNLPYIMVTA